MQLVPAYWRTLRTRSTAGSRICCHLLLHEILACLFGRLFFANKKFRYLAFPFAPHGAVPPTKVY